MTDAPIEEGQRENIGGILGSIKDFIDWAGQHPKRSLVGMFFLGIIGTMALVYLRVDWFLAQYEDYNGNRVSEQLLTDAKKREGRSIDETIERMLLDLRFRTNAGRGAARTYVYAFDDAATLIAVRDVFETNDGEAERSGIRSKPLPLEDIEGTTRLMLSDPSLPRCIARNTEEFPDGSVRTFLLSGGFRSSVVCPIVDPITKRLAGLLAFSSRTPIERNLEMKPRVRDASLTLGALWDRSPKVKAVITEVRGDLE